MLSRYDATQAARVDCEFARKYDNTQQARVDCEFARAYDETEGAWVDKLYTDFFTLQTKTLQSGDILEVKNSGISLRTFSTGVSRGVSFFLPYKWKYTDVVEFDMVTNALGRISIGHRFHYNNGWTVSGGGPDFEGEYNQHYVWDVRGTCPDTYEGYPTYDCGIYISISIPSDHATGETYSEIKNLTLNGKKIGFTE